MYRGRGGRGGYGRGGFGFGGASTAPTSSDTLLVQISEVRYAVNEDIIQKVFESAGAVTRVYVAPQTNPKEATAVVQFASAEEADKALRQRNLRHIYENCNKMTITFTNWWEHVPEQAVLSSPPSQMHQQAGSLFAAPVVAQNAYGGMYQPQQPMAPPQHIQQPSHLSSTQQHQTMTMMPSAAGFPVQQGYMTTAGQAAFQPQLQAATVMVPPTPSVVVGAANPPTVTVGSPNAMSMLMGGGGAPGFNPMGATRGGRGGITVGGRGGGMASPMQAGMMQAGMMNPQLMAMMMMNPAFMMQPGLVPQQGNGLGGAKDRGSQNAEGTTVYISVAFYDPELPLVPLFTLLEAYGGVVSIRRNHNRPEIVTVKMATPQDADACCKYLRQAPIGSKTVSAKHFGQYQERHPCTDELDVNLASTTQFDFTASRHRSPAHRSKTSPSKLLKVTNVPNATEADLMAYFSQVNIYPENIKKEGDVFIVRMDTLEAAVKLLVQCQSQVCGEEKSNVIFIEDPNAAAEQQQQQQQQHAEPAPAVTSAAESE